jgi:hypothetical protein
MHADVRRGRLDVVEPREPRLQAVLVAHYAGVLGHGRPYTRSSISELPPSLQCRLP